MTTEEPTCRLCESTSGHLASCRECSRIFCEDHIDRELHFCGCSVYGVTLANGSEYYFPVDGWRRALVQRYSDRSRMGPLLSIVFASPVTFALLAVLWVWFGVQVGTLMSLGAEHVQAWAQLFGLTANTIHHPWQWIVSMISHGGLFHLFVNSLVLAMFGPFVERSLGSRRFFGLFLLAGVLSGLAQVGVAMAVGAPVRPVMGASGALSALLGVYATTEPDARVLLFFIIPVSMWIAALVLIVGSFATPLVWGIGAFGIGHLAHGTGAILGVAVGLSHDMSRIQEHLQTVKVQWRQWSVRLVE